MKVGAASAPVGFPGEPSSGLSDQQSRVLEALYHRHGNELRRYIASRFGAGPPEPDEVAQAAFAKLAATKNFESLGDAPGYLFAIARNFVFDHHRNRSHRDSAERDMQLRAETMSVITPERVLLDRESVAIFHAALKKMPAMRRRIFLMVRVDGMTPKELARQFRVTESAIHKHVARALQDCTEAFKRAERHGRPR